MKFIYTFILFFAGYSLVSTKIAYSLKEIDEVQHSFKNVQNQLNQFERTSKQFETQMRDIILQIKKTQESNVMIQEKIAEIERRQSVSLGYNFKNRYNKNYTVNMQSFASLNGTLSMMRGISAQLLKELQGGNVQLTTDVLLGKVLGLLNKAKDLNNKSEELREEFETLKTTYPTERERNQNLARQSGEESLKNIKNWSKGEGTPPALYNMGRKITFEANDPNRWKKYWETKRRIEMENRR